MADKKPVKWDGKGNPIVEGAKKKAKQVKLSILDAAKRNAPNIITAGVAGAVSVGLGMAVASKVPTLRRWVGEGGWKRAAAIGLPSLGVAGVGLALASKTITSPKKAMEMAPWVLGGTALLAAGPIIAVEVSQRIDTWVRGMLNGGAAQPQLPENAGAGPVPQFRARRRALTPDEVELGRQQQRPAFQAGRRW